MRWKDKRSGFALISVLALVSILVMMLGALIGTNRTTFGMLRVTQAKDRIDRTISSAYSYCRYRLEHDYTWGREPFSGDETVTWGHLSLSQVASSDHDVRRLEGYDQINNTRFSIRICNNLRSDGEVALLKDIQETPRRGPRAVPSGFCFLEIAVEGDGHLEGAEIMVRNPGLVGAVGLANDALTLDAQELELFTRDPIKNQARALGTTTLTSAENFFTGQNLSNPGPLLQGELAAGFASRDNPVIWSGAQTQFGMHAGETLSRQQFKAQHPTLSLQDQRFVDESRSLFDIPDVKINDLQEVRFADGGEKPVEEIPQGLYRFEQYGYKDSRIRVLTRRELVTENPESTAGTLLNYWWMLEGTDTITPAEVASRVGNSASPGQEVSGGYVAINGAGGHALADVQSRRMVLDERVNFEVKGDFGLIGSAPLTGSNPTGDQDKREVNPALYFGNPAAIKASGNWNVGGAANQTNETSAGEVVTTAEEKGSLKTSGKLHVQGDISGSTTLAAGGDVTLELSRFFDPVGNSEANFSVFSEQSISILPPPILEGRDGQGNQVDDREVDEATGKVKDKLVWEEALGAWVNVFNISENTLKFTGLLYAQKDVKIDLQDTRVEDGVRGPLQRRNLIMEGAVVAKNGKLSVSNAEQLRLIYNPQFVDQLLPGVMKTGRRRVEVTGWKTTKPVAL